MMQSDEPAGANFKCVCADFPNIALLTKSTTPGDIQVKFGRASIGNKSLRETIDALDLARSLESLMVVSINAENEFSRNSEKIYLLVMEASFAPSLATSHAQKI